MAAYTGFVAEGVMEVAGQTAGLSSSLGPSTQWQAASGILFPDAAVTGDWDPEVSSRASDERDGLFGLGIGEDYWEKLIARPVAIDAGLVLVTKAETFVIHNTFRKVSRYLVDFDNNVDAGVLVPDLPSLPAEIEFLHSLILTVQVTPDGPAKVDGTLDFTTDLQIVYLPITGLRSVVFPFEPVDELIECLQFSTDVIRLRDDKEQRVSLRAVPRSVFEITVEETGRVRQFLNALTFSSQGLTFGFPLWHEPAIVTTPAAVDDYTVYVDSTDYASFAVGDLALVFTTSLYYELLQIASIGASSLTFETPFTKPFGFGSRVLPIRQAMMSQTVTGEKYPRNFQRATLRFTVLDNDVDIADTSAFPSYNGKVLLDEPNMLDGSTLRETMERRLTIIDNVTGVFQVTAEADVSRRGSAKAFFCDSRQRLWEVRQLLYALRGRAVSFYLPTFYDEFTPTDGITAAGTTLTFENYGYTKHVAGQQPMDVVRLILTDGTAIIRRVVDVTEVDEDEETIEVDSAWGVDADVDEIDRVGIVEKVRADSDEIEIRHRNAIGGATVRMPVKAVLE